MKLPKKPLEQARASEQYPKFRSELQPDITPMPGDIDYTHHPHYDNQPMPEGSVVKQTWRFGVRPTNYANPKFPSRLELSSEARQRLESRVREPRPLPKRPEPLKPGETLYGRLHAADLERKRQLLEQKPEINLESKTEINLESQQETPNLEQRKTSILSGFKKTSSLFSEEPTQARAAKELRETYESRASERLQQKADAHMEGLRRPDFDVQTNPLAAISEHFVAKSNQNQPTRAFERAQHITNAVRPAPSNLIRTARASGFKTSQLTSAIQRFTDPTANKAVRTGIMAGLHHSPSLSLEVQRSLELSDANLEVQRQEFLTQARETENNLSLSERIANELNGGVPLEENIRKQLEAHFNTDLSKVRVHTDGKAHELAKSANAIAFTTGNNIFFQSGKFDPNSSSGFELLAHETAHTIQQASGQVSPGIDSSPNLESDAKVEGQKAVGNKGNLERQANSFNDFLLKPKLEPARTEITSTQKVLQNANTGIVQRMVSSSNGLTIQREESLDPGERIGKPYPTLDMAITYARSLGKAALVYQENNLYVVHLGKKVGFDGFFSEKEFTADSVAKDAAGNTTWTRKKSNVLAVITEDGAVMRPDTDGKLPLRESPGLESDPFGSHQDVFGTGLSEIKDKDKFLRQFELAMRDTAFLMLEASEKEAKAKQNELKTGLPQSDKAKVIQTAKSLETVDQEISKLETAITAFRFYKPVPFMQEMNDKVMNDAIAAEKKLPEVKQKRLGMVQVYPLLSQFDAEAIKKFNALKTDEERAKILGGAVPEILENINKTRKNIRGGDLNLWSIPGIVEGVKTGLKLEKQGQQWVDEKAKAVKVNKAIWDIALAALAIGGALIATFATGGLALAGAGVAIGAGTVSAVRTTEDYLTNKAAANTNINKELAIQPRDMSGEWAWVVVAWVGVGLDALSVFQALKAFKAAKVTQALIAEAAGQIAAQNVGKVTQNGEKITKELLLDALQSSTKGERGVQNAATLRQIVLEGLPAETKAQLKNLKVIILEDKEFAKRFKQTADAVTTFDKAGDTVNPIIYIRRGGNPLAIQEETQHLAQLANADKSTLNKISQVSEQNLANWGKFKPAQRAEIMMAKLELEIDAQTKALKQIQGASAELQMPYVTNISKMETELRSLRGMRQYPKLFEQLPELQSAIAPRLFSTYTRAPSVLNPVKLEALKKTLQTENPELLRQLNTSGYLAKVADSYGYDAKKLQELYTKYQLGRDAGTIKSMTFETYTQTSVLRGELGLAEGTQAARIPFPKGGTPAQNFAQAVQELEKMPSYTKFVDMLEKEGIAARGSIESELEAVMKAQGNKGFASVDDLRHAFKMKFRAKVMAKMTNSALSNEEKHVAFLRISEQLSSGDKGSLAEEWYKLVFSPKATSQVPITKEAMAKQGIQIAGREGGEVRYADLVDGNKIQEIKNIAGSLGKEELEQFADYMKIAQSQGKIAKDGKEFVIQKITYVFTNPEGAKANLKWIKAELGTGENSRFLSVEIFNTKGERMIVTNSNLKQVDSWMAR
jgi:Domain of unknown function (DUF4157)